LAGQSEHQRERYGKHDAEAEHRYSDRIISWQLEHGEPPRIEPFSVPLIPTPVPQLPALVIKMAAVWSRNGRDKAGG
jgi:hypothetical protein